MNNTGNPTNVQTWFIPPGILAHCILSAVLNKHKPVVEKCTLLLGFSATTTELINKGHLLILTRQTETEDNWLEYSLDHKDRHDLALDKLITNTGVIPISECYINPAGDFVDIKPILLKATV